MAGPILYSTNPWIAHDISCKYRKGIHVVWVSEYFDVATSPPGSAAAAIAPSSSPKTIYDLLWRDVDGEDTHSAIIKGYKKTFKRLAIKWHSDGDITDKERNEIIATVDSKSWKIWRPTLYVIAVDKILPPTRIQQVVHKNRAAYGPEMQIIDLNVNEFDIIEFKK